MKTGQKVSWSSSGGTAQGIIREIVRDGTVPKIPVKVTGSEDDPAARIEIIDDEGKPTGQMVGHKLSTLRKSFVQVLKAQYATDIFTTEPEAKARSMDMGLEGVTHVSTYDGQAVFMPAESHEAYLGYYDPQTEVEAPTEAPSMEFRMEVLEYAIQAVIEAVMNKRDTTFESRGEVTKIDNEQRIVYGYASVISRDGEPIVDLQGDVISAEEMEKAASDFMLGARVGKTMHQGEATTTIIHSFPMTAETKKAYQIESPYEAWLIAVKVHDDETWEKVKAGSLKDFSIGGKAQRRDI